MIRKMFLATLLVSLVPMAIQSQARGGQIVDQQNSPPPPSAAGTFSSSIEFFSPIGQSFTPSLSGLDFVSVLMMDVGSPNAGTFVAEIHQGTDGALLATSQQDTLPIGFGDGTRFGMDVDFNFSHRVALTPGDLYSFIIRDTNPGAGDNFFLSGTEGFDSYPRGQEIEFGQVSTGLNYDLFFREGITSVPEPASLLLLAIGAACAAAIARHRRHDR